MYLYIQFSELNTLHNCFQQKKSRSTDCKDSKIENNRERQIFSRQICDGNVSITFLQWQYVIMR